jgi:hypothetical protein
MKKYAFPLALTLGGYLAIEAGLRFDVDFILIMGGIATGTGLGELWKAARESAAIKGQK